MIHDQILEHDQLKERQSDGAACKCSEHETSGPAAISTGTYAYIPFRRWTDRQDARTTAWVRQLSIVFNPFACDLPQFCLANSSERFLRNSRRKEPMGRYSRPPHVCCILGGIHPTQSGRLTCTSAESCSVKPLTGLRGSMEDRAIITTGRTADCASVWISNHACSSRPTLCPCLA